jgi:hypothetical protein
MPDLRHWDDAERMMVEAHAARTEPRMLDLLEGGNSLALVELITRFGRDTTLDPNQAKLNDRLVGTARYLGIHDEYIMDALKSERQLVIYEP